jgi:hypothetical protein
VKCQEEQTSLIPIESGVQQGSVLGPFLYLLYTANFPTLRQTIVATFADYTAILASHSDPKIASYVLQKNLDKIHNCLKIWRIKANGTKSIHVTFTMKKETCPPVIFNDHQLPQADEAKCLDLHLDRRLTWQKHIWLKRLQLRAKLRQMYWILDRNSQLSADNKLLIYKAILKRVWLYGCQLWGTASISNIERIELFQSKVLRIIVNAPRFVPKWVIQQDLQIPSVKEEIKNCSEKYHLRPSAHPNQLATDLLKSHCVKRLKRFNPSELINKFNSHGLIFKEDCHWICIPHATRHIRRFNECPCRTDCKYPGILKKSMPRLSRLFFSHQAFQTKCCVVRIHRLLHA